MHTIILTVYGWSLQVCVVKLVKVVSVVLFDSVESFEVDEFVVGASVVDTSTACLRDLCCWRASARSEKAFLASSLVMPSLLEKPTMRDSFPDFELKPRRDGLMPVHDPPRASPRDME